MNFQKALDIFNMMSEKSIKDNRKSTSSKSILDEISERSDECESISPLAADLPLIHVDIKHGKDEITRLSIYEGDDVRRKFIISP